MNNILQAKIKNKKLVNVSDISEFTNNSDFNKKIKTLVTKAKLKAEKEKNSETSDFWFKLFLWQKSYWRQRNSKFSISANL